MCVRESDEHITIFHIYVIAMALMMILFDTYHIRNDFMP
jgi:hypothetical protein